MGDGQSITTIRAGEESERGKSCLTNMVDGVSVRLGLVDDHGMGKPLLPRR
jgi:hypothetical protein